MARVLFPGREKKGRTQATHKNQLGIVYLGPPAQTPVLSAKLRLRTL